ncbi:TonB-dependent receptor [Flavicella sediminum]|uniref:TonB-dependent receptor n=1 Tax=Flavicella sediminum TaxID=2585141 RepID=UPI00111E90C9|nr:TonB-dependent receptor [Flavicella sediminum]
MRKDLLLLLFVSMASFAQKSEYKVLGKVVSGSGEPLFGATVLVDDNLYAAVVNENGDYSIENIPTGKHIIEASYMGFSTGQKEIYLESKNKKQHIHVNFSLSENSEALEIVHVHGESKKTRIEKKGFAVAIIETKEASQRNVQTNELLKTSVGVNIRQNGGLGSDVKYSLNGLSGSAVRIFIDGIPISVYGSSFSLNSIPPSMIKRIEVYKGVVPGHLADDALGGAINIVLHKGTKSNLNAAISYGSFNTFQTSLNGLYRAEKSGFTVKASGFYNYSDNDYKVSGKSVVVTGLGGVQTPITAKRFNDAYESTGGMFQMGFTNVNWADQFFIGITGSDDYKEIQHGAFMTVTPYKDRFMESDAMLGNLTYQKKNLFTKGLDVNLHGLYGKRNRVVSDTNAWAYSWNGQKAIDYKGDEFEYSWGSQQEKLEFGPVVNHINRYVASIRTGVSYRINHHHKFLLNHVYSGVDRKDRDAFASSFENTFVGTRDLYKNIFSATYELQAMRGKLKANVFGKYYQQKTVNIDPYINEETNKIEEEVIKAHTKNNGYGFAFSFALLRTITLLTSAEKAIRLPNESEVFGDDGDNVVANPSINPEKSENFNLGFRFGNFSIKKHDFTISTNLFTRNIKDRIGLPIDRNPDEVLLLYENQGSGTSKGIEAQLDYRFHNNFGFNFNVSHFSLKIKNNGVEIDVPNTPFFTMNGNLRYSVNNFIQKKARLNLFYTLYFTDEFSYIPPQGNNTIGNEFFNVPVQLAQDFGFSYTFPKKDFVLSFDIKNIFDKPLYDNLRVQKPGRAFYLKLNYSINKF